MWREQHVLHTERKRLAEVEANRRKTEIAMEAEMEKVPTANVWKKDARAKMLKRLHEMSMTPSEKIIHQGKKKDDTRPAMSAGLPEHLNGFETVASRAQVLLEGARIADELNDRDAEGALVSFERYDEDDSGTLELVEIRAVLGDLGLLPKTEVEKVAVRRTLVNFAKDHVDGDSDMEELPSQMKPNVQASVERCEEEHIVRTICVTKATLHDFITRVRARLKATRSMKYIDGFRRYDVFEMGSLDLDTVRKILDELNLFGAEQDQEKTLVFFLEWLSKVICSDEEAPEIEFDPEAPTKWYFGTESLRYLLLGPETAQEPPWKVNGTAVVRHVMNQLKSRNFDSNEFEVFVDFLQVAKDSVALEKERSGAEEMGVTSARLFLEFRHELPLLREMFEKFDTDLIQEITESDVSMALNSLGIVPQGSREKVIYRRVLNLDCWNISRPMRSSESLPKSPYQSEGSVAGDDGGTITRRVEEPLMNLTPATSLRKLLDLPKVAGVATVTFQGFLHVLSEARATLHAFMKDDLRPLFERCLRRRSLALSMTQDAVIGIREVSTALEELYMAPTSYEDQQVFKVFLDEANEWGFSPMTIDFDTFVRLIRRIREWRASEERKEQRRFATEEMGFQDHIVQGYRVAFDILDANGAGELEISDVRKMFKLLRRNITSDTLRTLFAKVDQRKVGKIKFLELLRLVHYVDKPPAPRAESRSARKALKRSSLEKIKIRADERNNRSWL